EERVNDRCHDRHLVRGCRNDPARDTSRPEYRLFRHSGRPVYLQSVGSRVCRAQGWCGGFAQTEGLPILGRTTGTPER
ncbi:MAG: hypothetical protein ACREFY_20695, partial [Acetobacteraceae bacterium]